MCKKERVLLHHIGKDLGLFYGHIVIRNWVTKTTRQGKRKKVASDWSGSLFVPGQHGVENGLVLVDLVEHDVNDRDGVAAHSKQVQLVQGLRKRKQKRISCEMEQLEIHLIQLEKWEKKVGAGGTTEALHTWRAATAIPMELALSSVMPVLDLSPRSHIPKSGMQ